MFCSGCDTELPPFPLLREPVAALSSDVCSAPAGRWMWTTTVGRQLGFAQEVPGEGGSWDAAPGWIYASGEPWVQHRCATWVCGGALTVSPLWRTIFMAQGIRNNTLKGKKKNPPPHQSKTLGFVFRCNELTVLFLVFSMVLKFSSWIHWVTVMDTVSRFAEIKALGGNEEILLDGVGIFSASWTLI